VLGPDRRLEQSSDDGEPPGTGGPPILDVIRGRELSDVVAVVSRWFGGTLLGTGRLARAYGDATRAALDEVGVAERVLQVLCEVTVDIAAVGRLEHDLRSRGAHVLGVDYTGEATLRFAVPPRSRGTAEALVAELTSGASALRVVGEQWVDADG
jgi:putative IMPACT (imprinted ancient) family translation regulator